MPRMKPRFIATGINSCKGQNSCKGKGWTYMAKALCDAAQSKLKKEMQDMK